MKIDQECIFGKQLDFIHVFVIGACSVLILYRVVLFHNKYGLARHGYYFIIFIVLCCVVSKIRNDWYGTVKARHV
jgi:hypothetical protein